MTLQEIEVTFFLPAIGGAVAEWIFQGNDNVTSPDFQEIGSSASATGTLAVFDLMFFTDFFKNPKIELYDWLIPAAVVFLNWFVLNNTIFRNRE